jgi:hypothetical protein
MQSIGVRGMVSEVFVDCWYTRGLLGRVGERLVYFRSCTVGIPSRVLTYPQCGFWVSSRTLSFLLASLMLFFSYISIKMRVYESIRG